MKTWNMYTVNEIKSRGWLKRQLEIQADGLAGNLDKVWRDIRDSAWIGGDAEGWERVPYWLDGFIPLAHLLDNDDMKQRAKKYVDAILERQNADGWICPCSEEERASYDIWAVFLIAKVLLCYYDATGDERIPDAVYRCCKNCYELLVAEKIKMFKWGHRRWFEMFIALNFLKEHRNEAWIYDFARLLKAQGHDYEASAHLWVNPVFDHTVGATHVVNLAMMLKSEAVSHELLGEEYTDLAERLYDILMKNNGMPIGTFTGDEHIAGLSPINGTELCGIVEIMYSFEVLYAVTGDSKWAERLEVVAFNGLPATISEDMWAHQYDQMSNQIACIKFLSNPVFTTNGRDSHLFGLEPEFGCCTANFGQGWPKLATSLFMHNDDTVINVVPLASELDCDKVRIVLDTKYPFENRFAYSVEARKDFTFKVRVPSFAQKLKVNGKAVTDKELVFEFKAGEKKEIGVEFETVPFVEKRPYDLNTVKCGSLVFSVPIKFSKKMYEYEKKGVERKYPYCDYEYIPESDWSYAYCGEKMTLEKREISDIPFAAEKPPVVVKTKVRRIDWGFRRGYNTVCAMTPKSRKAVSEEIDIELYPYGCAKLRMTELPTAE